MAHQILFLSDRIRGLKTECDILNIMSIHFLSRERQ